MLVLGYKVAQHVQALVPGSLDSDTGATMCVTDLSSSEESHGKRV